MSFRILHIEPDVYSKESKSLLEDYAKVDYRQCNSQLEFEKLVSRTQYDVIFMKLGIFFGNESLAKCRKLKYIVTPTTGHNHIDEDGVLKRKIKIISLRGENEFLNTVFATAEHTLGLLLSVLRFIPQSHNDVLLGNWRRNIWQGRELHGETIGIIGYGRLGKMVVKYALSFGMKVIVYDIDDDILIDDIRVLRVKNLEDLLENSFVVSLHVPLNKDTNRFFSKDLLNCMRNGSILINTSRGELIDEDALLSSLKNNHLAAAALDVLVDDVCWGEKVQDSNKLIEYASSHNNLIITPHIGGYTSASINKTRDFVTHKFINILELVNE